MWSTSTAARTEEQRAVIASIVSGYWGRPDLDLDALEPLDPEGSAAAITQDAHRGRMRELMVMLELCRHPMSDAQVVRVEEYAAALGESGPGLTLVRTLVSHGAAPRPRSSPPPGSSVNTRRSSRSRRCGASRTPGLTPPTPRPADAELLARLRAPARPARGHPRPPIRRVLPAQRHRAPRGRPECSRGVRLARHVPCDRRLRADRAG